MNLSVEKFRRNTSEPKANGYSSNKDDSGTKLMVEEESQSDGGDTVRNKSSLKVPSFQFEGVRFTPKVIEFIDAFEGKQFAEKITIQNVGRNPVLVKIGEPNSFIFQVKRSSRRAKLLAAGASITRTVTYSYHNDDLVQKSQIPVQINGHLVDYPIVVKKAAPEIEVQPTKLDFKVINLGASAKTLMLTMHNSGGKRTRFEIDVGKNDLDLVVTPLRGTIRAKNQVTVFVEMMGLREGEYFKELWITTNEMPIRVPVLVEVVRPRLEVVQPNGTEDFTLINFRPTFLKTQRAKTFVLKNYSAEATLFITLAEVNGELLYLKDARKAHQTFGMFSLTSEEGRLEPFECRVMTVLFRPKIIHKKKGWRGKENEKKKTTQWEHIVFFRINRVHCIERKELAKVESKPTPSTARERSGSLMQSTASPSTPSIADGRGKYRRTSGYLSEVLETESLNKISSFLLEPSLPDEKILRLCLHGKAVEPEIVVEPSELKFETMNMGETKQKVLKITNNNLIPIKFVFGKTMNVNIVPREGWLQPEKARELMVKLTPTVPGEFQTAIKIDILAESDVVFDSDKGLKSIALYSVPIHYGGKLVVSTPSPKVTMGISPLVVDEIGFQKDLLTFENLKNLDVPFTAILMSQRNKPNWMKMESDHVTNVDNALVALPNDRPRNFFTWPKDKICRSVFKGFFRYSPPEDLTYTLSSQGAIEKKHRYELWKDFLSLMRELREQQNLNAEGKKCSSEYQLSSIGHHNMEDYNPKAKNPTENKQLAKFKSFPNRPRQALVPLSPMYLSNINVEPKLINFSAVAANTLVQETLNIENLNSFPVGIRFIPGKSAVSVLDGNTIIIQPMTTKSLQISFQTKDLGRYYGFLNYVINGSHEFKITISAFVTSKTLVLEGKDRVVAFGNYPQRNAFQPRSLFVALENLLQSPIKYHWNMPSNSAFVADLNEGEIPPRSKLLSEILLDLRPGRTFYSESNLVSESGSSDIVKMTQLSKKVPVSFVTNRIDMHDISLNLPTKVRPIIQNACYHDVVFEVTNWVPMPGVIVEPKEGVIKARSFFPLDVKIQIPVIMKFAFDVVIYVHVDNKISVKITGNVVVPVIRMKPAEIIMRKICAQSFDSVLVCAENIGTTSVELFIDFKGCPEYKVLDESARLFLPPCKSSKFLIRFEPKDVARYVFYLPVIVNKILGPPMMQEPATENLSFYISSYEDSYKNYGEVFETRNSNLKIPCICINCTVSPSLLKISTLNVNFRLFPNSHSQFQPQTITISNDFTDNVTFCIRNDDLGEANDSPFTLVPTKPEAVDYRMKSIKAKLRKGENLVLEAKFRPKKPGRYTAEIPIFIRGYNNGVVYNFISMVGELKKPKLFTECSEIHFPPLPLNIGCDAVISICAENYTSTDHISCIIWNSHEWGEQVDCLTTTWVNQPNVISCKGTQIFQVQINFRSSFPVAIRNYLLFLDSKGEHCTVLVTAVADNSSITTHAFLTTRTAKYKLVRDTPPHLKWFADEDTPSTYPVNKMDLKNLPRGIKKGGSKVGFDFTSEPSSSDALSVSSRTLLTYGERVTEDKAPRLVIQVTKSMSRPTQLSFVNLTKNSSECKTKGSSSTVLITTKSRVLNSFISQTDSYSGTRTLSSGIPYKRADPNNDVTHPNFPLIDTLYGKHFHSTLAYVERWMFEVVMRCDQYFVIPGSFQKCRMQSKPQVKNSLPNKMKQVKNREEKDFLDFLEEIVGPESKHILPERLQSNGKSCPFERAEILQGYFSRILRFLQSQGCLLPHIKAEYLLDYDDYVNFTKTHENSETFQWKNLEVEKINSLRFLINSTNPKTNNKSDKEESPKQNLSIFSSRESWKKTLFESYSLESEMEMSKQEEGKVEEPEANLAALQMEAVKDLVEGNQFSHEIEVLNKYSFDSRAKQAWLDIVIQVFRNMVLKKIVYKNTVPQIMVIEPTEKIHVETTDLNLVSGKKNPGCACAPLLEQFDSNLYTVQERVLLSWLNYHYNFQKNVLWTNSSETDFPPNGGVINNFDKDLADSVALIAVTASHCPYIVKEYFLDVFPKPDTLNKIHHNAGKLILAWRFLNLGLTVETADIIQPNPVFMLMLVTQLYEVLPNLHPRSLICFSAPLTTELTRTILLKNESPHRIFYEPKFVGEYEGLFRLTESSLIELKSWKVTEIGVVFTARKIKKVSATLILSGCVISPNFAKNLAFYLEGEPSELQETEKFLFSAPLYKVICTEIPVKSPYPEPTTYEIWYTTQQPVYRSDTDISDYVKPWSKIWNRKVSRRLFLNKGDITIEENKPTILGVTVACFTEKERTFWLLFREAKIGDFIYEIQIKTKPKVPQTTLNGFYSETWSPTSVCACSKDLNDFKPNDSNLFLCPFLLELNIPTRNEALWDSLKTMFLKTLQPQEKSFWAEHFELNIGICLILWLLSPEEEEEVVDEFVHVLPTRVFYNLKIEPPDDKCVTIPKRLEISDVREKSQIRLPVHLAKDAPQKLKMTLTMNSENGTEVRTTKIFIFPPEVQETGRRMTTEIAGDSRILGSMCKPFFRQGEICRKRKKDEIEAEPGALDTI